MFSGMKRKNSNKAPWLSGISEKLPWLTSGTSLLFPLFLLLLNIILKIIRLDHRDIAMDEPFSIFYSQADFHTLFAMLKTENNPPLYFILLHAWIRLFGISALSVRFLSFVFSVLTALVIYRTGTQFFSRRAGILASLLFTFSSYELLFAHEARVYALFGLLTSLSMYCFLKMVTSRERKEYVWMTGLVNILLVYSHFFGFFVVIIQLASCLAISDLRRNCLRKYFISFTAVVVSYLPYATIFFSRFYTSASEGTWVPKPVATDLYTMLWRFSNAPVTTVFLIALLVIGIVTLIIERRRTGSLPSVVKVLLIWFFLPYFLMFAISFKIPMFLDRYVIFISIGYFLLIGVLAARTFRGTWLFASVTLISVILMAATFNPDADNKRRLHDAVNKVRELKTENSAVVICPSWLDKGFSYYYNPAFFKDYRNCRALLRSDCVFPVNSAAELDSTLLDSMSRIIYFEEWSTLVDRDDLIRKLLMKNRRQSGKYNFYESFTVEVFSRK
jgi:mannosyltransferase